MPCQGLFDRKFEILYNDGNAGATTAQKLWTDKRKEESERIFCTSDGQRIDVICDCCMGYTEWKNKHQAAAKLLQKIADVPCYYKISEEQIKVGKQTYQNTIRALHIAPKGACKGTAFKSGPHPYTCDACEALCHGKNSQLMHKFRRASTLKHPRTEEDRATYCGVSHKYCSKEHLEMALLNRRVQSKTQIKKINQLTAENEKLLLDSWKSNATARPFVEQLLKLFDTNQLSKFDLNFLDNWLGKKVNGRLYHAGEQARNLAILLSNRLGKKMYSTVAPIMGLPLARQTQRLRSTDNSSYTYMPGLNDWAFKLASKQCKPFHNSMDGTRVVRTIELYENEYLVGESFSPDVRLFPEPQMLPKLESREQVQEYVLSVRARAKYAAEAYSFDLVDTTGKSPDLMLGSIPEATSGVTASHIYALMLEVEHKASTYGVSLIGHCTDSASNSLNALIKLGTPSKYLVDHQLSFLGLQLKGYRLLAPFFRKNYPSIAYACWDHSGRTVLRNLMNQNRTIIAEVQEKDDPLAAAIEYKSVATVHDLHHLKRVYPASSIKHGDISIHIHQNCDATSRVLTNRVIDELKVHVPASNATQLYLQAAVWTHCPYRNENYGPPPAIARSLWAGIMTWRRWRQYINLMPGLSLETNFMSRQHYLTEEVLVHAGINHLLCLYLCFPDCDLSEYHLRDTGNRGIEAIHGIFRGGSCSLPITSANLSFREFLCKMNTAQQIQRSEHFLSTIEGNSIVATKKKRKTFAARSNESPSQSNSMEYALPSTYKAFMTELQEACKNGDTDSKNAIQQLAPQMAAVLIKHNQWLQPDIPFDAFLDNVNIISNTDDVHALSEHFISELITQELGPLNCRNIGTETTSNASEQLTDDSNQALANYLIDIMPTTINSDKSLTSKGMVYDSKGDHIRATTLLKGLQPQREIPNKNRGKRFAAGELVSNKPLHIEGNDVEELQFWTLYPMVQALKHAKMFLLGRISLILNEGKPCTNAENNPSVQVVLTIYDYDQSEAIYHPKGKTALLNASKILQMNVTQYIKYTDSLQTDLTLNTDDIEKLNGYIPFSMNVDIDGRLASLELASTEKQELTTTEDEEEPFNVESIVKKQFNSKMGQFEFLVKWKGYSEKHNTWELINNIPEAIIDKFELQNHFPKITQPSARSGLRDRETIKAKYHKDFISND